MDQADALIREAYGEEVASGNMDSVIMGDIQQFVPGNMLKGKIVGKAGDDAVIDVGSMSLQLLTGVVLAWLGVTRTLLAIPAILGAAVAAFAFAPHFLTMAVAKVASKSFDYSLFRAAKEILYIPLSYPEKTQGKAVIDMLTYRVAKAGASILLLVVAGGWVIYVTLGLIGCWFAVIRRIAPEYQGRLSDAG